MGEIISRAKLFINFSGGNYQLKRVKTYDVTREEELEVVLAVGVTGGAGYRDKEGGGEISLEVFREDGSRAEVNWQKLRRSKERFTFVIRDVGGQAEQFQNVRVANVGRKGDDSGNNMMPVKLKFLGSVDL